MANYPMNFGLNGDVNKTPKTEKDKRSDRANSPSTKIKNVSRNKRSDRAKSPNTKSVSNAISHSDNNIIETINGGYSTRNIQRVDTQSYSRTVSIPNANYLDEVYEASAVVGFVALNILTSVI